MTADFITQIEPLAERIVSIEAAMDFYLTANPTSARLDTLTTEQHALFVEGRRIAHAAGTTLPGIRGLREIADRYTERLATNA